VAHGMRHQLYHGTARASAGHRSRRYDR
jgi:hypothetical protein